MHSLPRLLSRKRLAASSFRKAKVGGDGKQRSDASRGTPPQTASLTIMAQLTVASTRGNGSSGGLRCVMGHKLCHTAVRAKGHDNVATVRGRKLIGQALG